MTIPRRIVLLVVLVVLAYSAGIARSRGATIGEHHRRFLVVANLCTRHPAAPGPRVQYRVFSKRDAQDNPSKRSERDFYRWDRFGIMPTTYGQLSGVWRIVIYTDGTTKVLDHVGYVPFRQC